MHHLIRTANYELAAILEKHLHALGEDWWTAHVENRLSFQQQRIARERGLRTLQQLDFAALLRILDQNWFELSQVATFTRESRTLVRELQAVRNRWAHLSAAPILPDDLYRDVDTLSRVLRILRACFADPLRRRSVCSGNR